MLTIEKKDFHTLVNFVQANYGIDLSKKEQLIVGRLQFTVLEKGYKDFAEYVKHITEDRNSEDIEVMLNKLTTIPGVTGVHTSFVLRRVVDRTALPVGAS